MATVMMAHGELTLYVLTLIVMMETAVSTYSGTATAVYHSAIAMVKMPMAMRAGLAMDGAMVPIWPTALILAATTVMAETVAIAAVFVKVLTSQTQVAATVLEHLMVIHSQTALEHVYHQAT
jgi:hypothetical protein